MCTAASTSTKATGDEMNLHEAGAHPEIANTGSDKTPEKPFQDGRSAGVNWTYRGSLTREQWLLTEIRIIARLRLEGLGDAEILEQNLNNNYFQYPTEREIRSITRACLLRLDNLSDNTELKLELTRTLANGTSTQTSQINLYAIMRTYRLVWEFMVGVIGHKYQTFDTQLAKHEIAAYLEGLRSQSDVVAAWSNATLNKIRQVLTRCLVSAGYLTSPRSDELRPVLLDLDLERALRENGDAAALPAFNCLD